MGSYNEKLTVVGLTMLEARKNRGDLVQTYKPIKIL